MEKCAFRSPQRPDCQSAGLPEHRWCHPCRRNKERGLQAAPVAVPDTPIAPVAAAAAEIPEEESTE